MSENFSKKWPQIRTNFINSVPEPVVQIQLFFTVHVVLFTTKQFFYYSKKKITKIIKKNIKKWSHFEMGISPSFLSSYGSQVPDTVSLHQESFNSWMGDGAGPKPIFMTLFFLFFLREIYTKKITWSSYAKS